jgi:hypothetical protein
MLALDVLIDKPPDATYKVLLVSPLFDEAPDTIDAPDCLTDSNDNLSLGN